jgi:futalosine hydrolase
LRILIVAATQRDVKKLKDRMQIVHQQRAYLSGHRYGNLLVDVLVTGAGGIFMAYHLTKILGSVNYDLAVNIGIAGSFDYFLEQGFVVNVVQDQFADMGIEEKGEFYTLGEKEMMDENSYPFTDEILRSLGNFEIEEIESLIPVKAVTVNTLHGSKESIKRIKEKFNPEIETMDGAAFFYVCLSEKIPFLQVRAISNFVEIRRIENWNIPLAIDNLTDTVIAIFDELRID